MHAGLLPLYFQMLILWAIGLNDVWYPLYSWPSLISNWLCGGTIANGIILYLWEEEQSTSRLPILSRLFAYFNNRLIFDSELDCPLCGENNLDFFGHHRSEQQLAPGEHPVLPKCVALLTKVYHSFLCKNDFSYPRIMWIKIDWLKL